MSIYSEKPWLRFYDAHIAEEIPLPGISYLDFLEQGLNANPGHVAFHFLGTRCTYRQLNDLSDRFAGFLVDRGCVKGDVVGINLPNIPQYLVATVGTLKAGCVVSGVSPLLTPREMVYQLKDSKAKALLTMDVFFEQKLLRIADQIPDLQQVVVTNVADFLPAIKQFAGKLLKKIPTGEVVPIKGKGVISYKRLMKTFPLAKPKVDLTPDDACAIQYTGGTTGSPKGVVLTQRNILFNNSLTVRWMDKDIHANMDIREAKRGEDIMCSGFPFFHTAGLLLGMWAMAMGNTQILIPDPRNTDQICKDMIRIGVTQTVNVPTLTQLIMENPLFEKIDFSSLKFFASGAAPISVEMLRKLNAYIGEGKVVELYGLTETCANVTMNPRFGQKKLGSVGIPIPNTKIRIVDVQDGITEKPVGEPGELIVSGPQVMKEYLGNPEANQAAFVEIDGDRYVYTGDVLRMDEDGFLYVVDRSKDMMLVGGYNVYSKEVEDILYEVPEIEFCAVVGEPNPDRPGSELVKAVIQLLVDARGKDEKEVKERISVHCRENLAPYKVPKIIEFTAEIPLTAVGKVDKKAIRKPISS